MNCLERETFKYKCRLRPRLYVINLDLGVKSRRVEPEQSRSPRLVTAGLIESAADEIDLEFLHFVIEIDAARNVDLCRRTFGRSHHF